MSNNPNSFSKTWLRVDFIQGSLHSWNWSEMIYKQRRYVHLHWIGNFGPWRETMRFYIRDTLREELYNE